MASTVQTPVTVSRAASSKRRTFRVQGEMPLAWSNEILSKYLQERFPDHEPRVDSLYKHPTEDSTTALVTFTSPVPEELSRLDRELDPAATLSIGDRNEVEIVFDHCFGLTILFEPHDREPPKADVVFIHGLNGHAIGSWAASNGKCWPRDFLGKDLPTTRIITFGYNAKLHGATCTSQLSDYGTQLLRGLSTLRESTEEQRRPLIFIGHSFGGTIITWVLHELSSKRDDVEYRNTLKAIRCAAFFGVPHQGMSLEYLEPLVDKRTKSAMGTTMNDLQADSGTLLMLRETLRNLYGNMRFITCVEQILSSVQEIDGQVRGKVEAVNRSSALLYCQNEDYIPINADHRGMIKFSCKTDRHYLQVRKKLRHAVENCGSSTTYERDLISANEQARQTSSIRTLTVDGKQALLKPLCSSELEERQIIIRNAHETTCEWLLESPEYGN